MKKIYLLTVVVVLSILAACKKNTNEPTSGGNTSNPDWAKSDNFVIVELNEACSTIGCKLSDLTPLESKGWKITDEGKYIHMENTIDKVEVVMNCYINDTETIFHTTCSLSPQAGSVLNSLSYVKSAVETLSSAFLFPTSETCAFRLLKYRDITSNKNHTITDYGKALAAIDNNEYNYSIIWADMQSTDYDELSDALWFGDATGLNLGFYMLSEGACLVSMEVTSKKYY